ncbi:hypothetical protein CR513_61794, partial [Mucuna pruriens]
MRSFSKNKFLLCFRPVVDIDVMLESKVAPHRSSTCRFSRIPTSDKHQMIKNSETKSLYFHHVSPKRTISRVVKAVFFDTLLNRRAHNKNRYIHDSFGYEPKYLTYAETKTPRSPMSTSSSPSSSSHASSQSKVSNYHSTNEKKKESDQRGPLEKQKKFECYGIYLVLISLAFTVFGGKLFGIFLTSILLYFFSVWDSSSPCQKRLPSCPRVRQSLQGKDTRNYDMAQDYHMAIVPINLYQTRNRDLQFIRNRK